jgi:hypothetical protein
MNKKFYKQTDLQSITTFSKRLKKTHRSLLKPTKTRENNVLQKKANSTQQSKTKSTSCTKAKEASQTSLQTRPTALLLQNQLCR